MEARRVRDEAEGLALAMVGLLFLPLILWWLFDASPAAGLYTFQSSPLPTPTPPGPWLELDPATGAAGTSVAFHGGNFTAGQSATLLWDGQALETIPESLGVSSAGEVAGWFTIPTEATDGVHTVRLQAGTEEATAPFEVRNPTPTPSPTPTRTPLPTPTPGGPVRGTPTYTPTPTPSPSPTPTPTPTPNLCITLFEDDFDDPALPGWGKDVPASGEISVSGGVVTLRNRAGQYTDRFPMLWRNDLFPAQGDFALEYRYRYEALTAYGVSVSAGSRAMPVPRQDQSQPVIRELGDFVGTHQFNAANTWQHTTQAESVVWSGPRNDTGWHTVRVEVEGETRRLFVDGVLVGKNTLSRPVSFWAGNYYLMTYWGDWSDVSLDYVRVERCSPPPPPEPTPTPVPQWCGAVSASFSPEVLVGRTLTWTATVRNLLDPWGQGEVFAVVDILRNLYQGTAGGGAALPALATGEEATVGGTLPAPAPPSGYVFYRVRLVDADNADLGCASPWVPVRLLDDEPLHVVLRWPPNGAWLRSREVEFRWDPASVPPGTAPVDGYRLQAWGEEGFVEETPPMTATTHLYTVDHDRTLFWSVQAHNAAGWGRASDPWVFGIDTRPPTATATLSGTMGTGGWYTAPVSVALQASDPQPGSGVWGFYCGPAPWSPCPSGFVLDREGAQLFAYYASDVAGNTSMPYLQVVRIDTRPPVITPSLQGVQGLGGWYTTPVTLSATFADPVPGSTLRTWSTDGLSGTTALRVESEGTSLHLLEAQDVAGWRTQEAVVVPIDTRKPVLSSTLQGPLGHDGWYTGVVTLSVQALDPMPGSGLAASSPPQTLNDEGETVAVVWAQDVAGWRTEEEVPVRIDTQAPTATLQAGDFCPACGQGLTFSLLADDGTSGVRRWEVRIVGSNGVRSSMDGEGAEAATYTWTPPRDEPARYDLVLEVEDVAGNRSLAWASAYALTQPVPTPTPTATPTTPTPSPSPSPTPTPRATETSTPTPTAVPAFGGGGATPTPTPTLTPTPSPSPTPTPTPTPTATPTRIVPRPPTSAPPTPTFTPTPFIRIPSTGGVPPVVRKAVRRALPWLLCAGPLVLLVMALTFALDFRAKAIRRIAEMFEEEE